MPNYNVILAVFIVAILVIIVSLKYPKALYVISAIVGISVMLTLAKISLQRPRYTLGGNTITHKNIEDPQSLIHELQIYSQNGEDGIIESIFIIIGTTNKYFVECGVRKWCGTNTWNLIENKRWKGIVLNSDDESKVEEARYLAYDRVDTLHPGQITTDNIKQILKANNVPIGLDFISINFDASEYDLWKEICIGKDGVNYRPRVVAVKYNASYPPPIDVHVENDPNFKWVLGSTYYSASLTALTRLGRQLGYTLVYAGNRGIMAFFVRTDVVYNHQLSFGKHIGNTIKLYKPISLLLLNNEGWKGAVPRNKRWIENDTNVRDIFNRIIIYGTRNCPSTKQLITWLRGIDADFVIYYDGQEIPYEICRIAFLVCNDNPSSRNFLAAFTFIVTANECIPSSMHTVESLEGTLNISRIMFNSSTVIEESKDLNVWNFVHFINFPTSMGRPDRILKCRQYITDSTEYPVGEQEYGNLPGDKNYETPYIMRVANNDATIQTSLKKKTLFNKDVIVAGSPYARRPNLPGQSVTYDVGGNIGNMGIPFSQVSDIVISFEPFERTFIMFEANIRKNKAYNNIVIFAAVGDTDQKEVFLSDRVGQVGDTIMDTNKLVKELITTTQISDGILINNTDSINYGSIRLGTGGQPVQMVKLDTVSSCLSPSIYVSLLKVDIEGAEPLAFNGALETIKKYNPCIIFEKNARILDQEMLDSVKSNVPTRSPMDIIKSNGYKDFRKLRFEDYMAVPDNRMPAYIDSSITYTQIDKLPEFLPQEIAGMQLSRLGKFYDNYNGSKTIH